MKKDNAYTNIPLVAIDPGSSSLKAMAAISAPGDEERLHILGFEQSKRMDCISKGRVIQTSSLGYLISEELKLLSNRINRIGHYGQLSSAFVTVGGKNMGCANIPAKRVYGYQPVLSASYINEMVEECKAKFQQKYPDYSIIHIRPAHYDIDGEIFGPELPLGKRGDNIHAMFTAFYGDNKMLPELTNSFDRSAAAIEDIFPRPVALLEALASEEDERLGLAILDFGAETTTVTVYKNGEFIRSRTIPLGGRNITSDIQQMHIAPEFAEMLKQRYGLASEYYLKQNQTLVIPSSVQGEEDVRLPKAMLTEIINSRLDEILQEPLKILQQYEDTISVVYVTGGASRLSHLVDYLGQIIRIPVVYGSHADWLDDDTPKIFYAPEYSALVGSLLLARKYRRTHQPPAPKKTIGKVKEALLGLFTDQQ